MAEPETVDFVTVKDGAESGTDPTSPAASCSSSNHGDCFLSDDLITANAGARGTNIQRFANSVENPAPSL